ncbi:general secretion pathway protein GspB [Pseudoalteromonas denitrificans]|uniref:General secretion pathway protein B n=1 Tax=Pseudoalteromonas denitrificans DSM 6059 TaxID=1123010 RepID=A0A1I1J8J8_9GAMM|nr:general secretion pathway protein GspB [Pseudoalteromonas denitrificans]SFC44441.1 general secretion pathway protein B [Pseudoalteromonas denitrificans DSM 6059]
MSYLLDALKQSEQGEVSRTEQYRSRTDGQYVQQKDLKFYRNLTFSLIAVLAILFTLVIGFLAGRWFQETKIQDTFVKQPSISENTNKQIAPILQQPSTQALPVQVQPILVQQAMPTQYQLVPVSNMKNTLQLNQNSQVPVQAYTSSKPLDYSQYKVVGKPIEKPDSEDNKSNESEELAQLPASLKAAFANAVAATENDDEYEVTTATNNSAMAQPIQLLPDVIQSLVPALSYQAHVYATEADRRWIKLNNTELYEGDSLGPLKVLEIAPEITLMSIEGYRFSLPAMDDWQP